VSNLATNLNGNGAKPVFGRGIDPVEAGRRGGIKSGLSRRLKPQRELERRIAEETRNGAAMVKLLEIQTRREKELQRERIRLDGVVEMLLDEADDLREQIANYKDWRAREGEKLERLVERRTYLEGQDRLLTDALNANVDEMLGKLRALHEGGGLEPLLVALDLFDVEEDADAVPSS
jgi:hypothetical protein